MTRWVRADDFLPNFRTPQLRAHGSKRILVAHPCSIFSSAAISSHVVLCPTPLRPIPFGTAN